MENTKNAENTKALPCTGGSNQMYFIVLSDGLMISTRKNVNRWDQLVWQFKVRCYDVKV